MFRSFFEKVAKKSIESDLDKLIAYYSNGEREHLFLLYDGPKNAHEVCKTILSNEALQTFETAMTIEYSQIDNDLRKRIVLLANLFVKIRSGCHDEMSKFGFAFWNTILLAIANPGVREKGIELWSTIRDGQKFHTEEFVRKAESLIGQKSEEENLVFGDDLSSKMPAYFRI